MDWVETENSRPDPKRNYTDICYLQILCPIRRLESSVEASRRDRRSAYGKIREKAFVRSPDGATLPPMRAGALKHEIHPPGVA